MKKTYILEITILTLLVIFNIILDIQAPDKIKSITREDGIVEMGTAVFYLIAACMLFILFIRSGRTGKEYFLKTKRNYFYLLLGLLLVFFAGEEISWGQRIFNYNVPENLISANKQGEFNIHNLPFLHGADENRELKKGLARLLSGSGLYAMFCLFYCVFIPLAHKFSKWIRTLNEKINVPVIPIWIGLMFVVNHAVCETIEALKLIASIPIVEIKEANYSVLFLMASIALFNSFRKSEYVAGTK